MSQLWKCSAREIARRVSAGEVSAVEVTEDALDRLAAVNPAINAVVAQMPDEARAAAAQVDAARKRGDALAPLAGVPITVKVNVDQAGHATTNGLRTQRDLIAREDNPVVANLRRAGAVIIGRTNTPAFSLRWFCRNGLHGHTRNPRDPSCTPGGSSGGAAAALTVGIGALAHGTDIGGSVRYPAYACGVHGLRPTLGRIPAWNPSAADRHIGAQLMAVSGPLARSVDDLRIGFAAMAARDARDPWWMPVPLELAPQPRRAALTIAPEGLEVAPQVATSLNDAAARLRDGGWQVDEVECPPLREPAGLQLRLWLAEFRRGAAAAIEREADPDASFIYQQMTEICPQPDLPALLDTLQTRVGLIRQWQQFLDQYPVLLCPVSAELPFPDQLDVESPAAFAACSRRSSRRSRCRSWACRG
jgi:amidase